MPPPVLVVPAHAKVNLTLDLIGPRADGFHDLASLVVPIDWHDLVGMRVAAVVRPTQVRLRLSGCGPPPAGDAASGQVPDGEANLATRAVHLLQALAGRPLQVDLWLHKRLPVAAGLGGGSADAAAVLTAGLRLLPSLGITLEREAIVAAASSLGSDVPAMLAGRASVIRGRGEVVQPTAHPRALHLAVVVAGESGTAATYAAVTPGDLGESRRVEALAQALKAGRAPCDEWCGSALEAPAVRAHPNLGAALTRLRSAIPEVRWHLTGSGGAAYALATSSAAAGALAGRARSAGFAARACRSLTSVGS